jgi:hypothetical protein
LPGVICKSGGPEGPQTLSNVLAVRGAERNDTAILPILAGGSCLLSTFRRSTASCERESVPFALSLIVIRSSFFRLQVVGLQHGVSALFDRYDFDGSGAVVVEQFVAMVLKCVPDANGALDLRNGFAAIRRAVRASAGVHGVRKLVQAIERRAKRGGLLGRNDLGDAIATELGAYVKEGDLRPIISVYDTDKAGVISLPELIFGLRGPLPRGRRILIDRAWAGILRKAGITTRGLPYSASIDIDTLAASVDTSAPCFHQNVSCSATLYRGCIDPACCNQI